MRRIFAVLVCLTRLLAPAGAAPAKALLDEVKHTFTIEGKPVSPWVFGDFGDSDIADGGAIRVTIDLIAATGSNLYFGDVTLGADGWRSQERTGQGAEKLTETMSYKYIGAAKNGLLVVITAYSGGGSGVFHVLHLLDLAIAKGFDDEGKRYDRLNLTTLRAIPLGDRWDGAVTISGNTIRVLTGRRSPIEPPSPPSTKTYEARRP